MVATANAPAPTEEAPHSAIGIYMIERNYKLLDCDLWNTRRVQLLCAKFGDTPDMMAARMRLRLCDFKLRCESDRWSKQDGLILSMLEQAVDFVKGGQMPKVGVIAVGIPL